jgi:hypothetical protein
MDAPINMKITSNAVSLSWRVKERGYKRQDITGSFSSAAAAKL